MQVLTLLRETIDTYSFSNLWYWIMLAVMWSRLSHRILGVPWDMVTRARRKGDRQLISDTVTITEIYARRTLGIARSGGSLMTAGIFAVLSLLITIGFYLNVQMAQAVALLCGPMLALWFLNLNAAQKISAGSLSAKETFSLLMRMRIYIQLVGMVAIFVTALWGMYQNLFSSVLGN